MSALVSYLANDTSYRHGLLSRILVGRWSRSIERILDAHRSHPRWSERILAYTRPRALRRCSGEDMILKKKEINYSAFCGTMCTKSLRPEMLPSVNNVFGSLGGSWPIPLWPLSHNIRVYHPQCPYF